jgi:hypothetical protein
LRARGSAGEWVAGWAAFVDGELFARGDDLLAVDCDAGRGGALRDGQLAPIDLDRVARGQAVLGLLAGANVDSSGAAPLLDRCRPRCGVARVEAGDDEDEDQDEADDEARDRARVPLELVSSRGSYGSSRARP